ncbi:threonine synthase [Blattabacterium cuenoti]|uniref:threonine synthase n=1 Tax=Blattabacterium cuenoti TaxID=1653831 RepID=UPI00163C8D1C|nr:threonine synthase [Blattabacterium cuenoti]
MLFYSLNNKKYIASFKEAVLQSLATDGTLFFPEQIPLLNDNFISNIYQHDIYTIAMKVIKPFVGKDIPDDLLYKMIINTFHFDIPLKMINDNIYVLELFNGPTLAFKDIGARFMSECLNYFYKIKKCGFLTVLVATSGDTGGAVAKGFHKIDGTEVIILYPSKGISKLQEQQINTLGKNIFSVEIQGNFDDCQNLVKKAFLDIDLQKIYNLTSANSINIARWIPQIVYYFLAYKQIINIEKNKNIIFSVPSGNFGNIFSGMIAEKMGLPIKYFIASTNINDTIPRFLKSGTYHPFISKPTISNAMDISDPSNFARIWNLYSKNMNKLKNKLIAYPFTDKETLSIINMVCTKYKYILDPHGAIGYLGLQQYIKNTQYHTTSESYIFLETAHPVKFFDKMPIKLQKQILGLQPTNFFNKKIGKKNTISITKNFNTFKNWLIKRKN